MSNVTPPAAINVNALLAEVARLQKANEALEKKKKASGGDKPLEAKLGTWTNKKDGKVHDMVNVTGNFRPINLSVNKCRNILKAVDMIRACVEDYDSRKS